MISLAPIKYYSLIHTNNEIIKRISFSEKKISRKNYGYEAHIILRVKHNFNNDGLYGQADGTGSDTKKVTAIYKGISEALERLAYISTVHSDDRDKYGFNYDSSSTGMAAYPGITKSPAKTLSRYEAIERWAIVEWWSKKIPCNHVDGLPNAIEIKTPFQDTAVVIIWSKVPNQNRFAYGFSANSSIHEAQAGAEVELLRNIFVLSKCKELIFDKKKCSLQEARLLFFSTPEGHSKFIEKIATTKAIQTLTHTPKRLVNTEIKGKWSRYTTVWRTLYAQTTKEHLSISEQYFLF